jgi:hypothetical protein
VFHLRHWTLGLAVAWPAFCYVQPAFACGALPCAQRNDLQPADGSTGVPVNTEIRVSYFGSLDPGSADPTCNAGLTPIRLLPGNGDAIDLEGTLLGRPSSREAWLVASPAEPLAANTRYAIQLQLGPGEDACRCDGREWVTVSSFTSGTGADQQAPTFAGITALDYAARVNASSDCGETDGFPAFPTLAPAADASPEPRYNVYLDGEIEKRFVQSLGTRTQPTELFVDCGSNALSTQTLVHPGQHLEVRAVDLAGHESAPNEPITIDVLCDAPDGQGGPTAVPVPDTADAGNATAAPPAPHDGPAGAPASAADHPASIPSASSCALSNGVAANARATLWVLVMLFWRRRVGKEARRMSPRAGC